MKNKEDYRNEFENSLNDDNAFLEQWGTPTKEDELNYKEKDFEEWFKVCVVDINNKMITKEEFLKNTNEDELFSVIESFLNRAREKGFFKVMYMKNDEVVNDEFLLTDEKKGIVIKEILEEDKK